MKRKKSMVLINKQGREYSTIYFTVKPAFHLKEQRKSMENLKQESLCDEPALRHMQRNFPPLSTCDNFLAAVILMVPNYP
jgi:hypothetical protein